ncbi:TolC family protein [Azohydromonas caseinilytica]|uniref:TolC family protein n=1 Tax=Azohydromonas caseinilytica TaxID=2728836 RepID=A0A848F475_9BURK|nr:TolC family protein [Azohydromonas caseinilytica]NML14877.1 TolC family protein [Azohydromonas caseinilytica]
MKSPKYRRAPGALRHGATLLLAALLAWPAGAATGAAQAAADPLPRGAAGPCADEEPDAFAATPDPQASAAARQALQALLQQAQARSQSVGAARLLAEAAQSDLEEARAQPLPQVRLGGGLNALNQHQGLLRQDGVQGQASLSLSAPLFDAGRSAAQADWRERLLEAARQGELDAREQVALQTVSLALERQRYRRQVEVYARYEARMSCLMGALERIVAADRGRASELLQTSNTLRQVQLSLAQAQSQQRQVESRLRRFVGETLPPPAPLEALLPGPPALEATLDQAAHANAIAQLSAQAQAQQHLARATAAQNRPQLSWSVSGSRSAGVGTPSTVWSAGVNLSVPLLDLTAEPAQRAARQRAEATLLQRDEALSARLQRVAETHEQARAAFERAQASVEVLRGSQRVRQATLLQWQQLGRRSLFDVISSESEYHNLLVTRVNALLDAQQATALLWSLGAGVAAGLQQ